MRLNIWVILAALLALLVIARYMQHQETPRICVDDPRRRCATGDSLAIIDHNFRPIQSDILLT
jgi:hypothetical protein